MCGSTASIRRVSDGVASAPPARRGLDPRWLSSTVFDLARTIYDVLKKNLAAYAARADARYPISSQLRVVSVRLWETATSWAEYSEA